MSRLIMGASHSLFLQEVMNLTFCIQKNGILETPKK